QTVTYQSRILGEHAMGMGGAFVALADDPTASYYNPAGLAALRNFQLEVGLPVLGLEFTRLRGGLLTETPHAGDSRGLHVLSLPSAVGAATVLGPNDASGEPIFTGAVSLYIPWQQALSLRQSHQDDAGSALHALQQFEQTLLVGPSIAVRAGRLAF